MTRDQGLPKNHNYADWCTRIAMHSERNTATSSAATEHAAHDGVFRQLAKDILTHELTPEQKDDPAYKFREGKSVPTEHRSTISAIVRKKLGDARVKDYTFAHGVLTLLDPPLLRKPRDCYRALLQNMLGEFMMWHAMLLRWLPSESGILKRSSHKSCQTLIRRNGKLNDDAKKKKPGSE